MPANLNDYFNKHNRQDNNQNSNFDFSKINFNGFGKFNSIIYILAIIIIILVLTKPFVVVHSGEVGIKSNMGKYSPHPLLPGMHFFLPFVQDVFIVDTKVRAMRYTSNRDGEVVITKNSEGLGIINKNRILVLDARNLPVNVDITIQYQLNAATAPNTIAEWGLSWEDKIIDAQVNSVVRSVIGKYTAENLPTSRNEIAKLIDDGIRENIEKVSTNSVKLNDIQLRLIELPDKIKEQIERVQIAKQEAERTKYEVERANQEALKKAALAEGSAKAIKIEAQGRADAVKIEADASAYANKEIAKSLDEKLLTLKQIETQAKFNEALRENKDAKIFLTPGGAVPNIWVDTKDKARQSAINE